MTPEAGRWHRRVVFTGKTIGKQIAFTLKPFIFKWINSCRDNKRTGKVMKAVGNMAPHLLTQVAESEWFAQRPAVVDAPA